MKVRMARQMTVGTKKALTRSTRRCTGALELCARRTEAMMRASSVAAPTRRAVMRSEPFMQRVPAVTSSPSVFSTGIGSPESILSSTDAGPLSTVPSTGMRSPGRTNSVSPGRMDEISTVRCEPSDSILTADDGCSPIRAFSASPAWRRLLPSMNLPVSTNAMIIALPS